MSYYNLNNKLSDLWKAVVIWFSAIRNLLLFFVISFILILVAVSTIIVVQNRLLKSYSDRIATYEFPIATVASNLNSDLNRQAFSLRGNIIRKDTAWQYERDLRWEEQMIPDLNRLLEAKSFFPEEATRQKFDSLAKYLQLYRQMEEEANDWLFKYYVLKSNIFIEEDTATYELPHIEDLEKDQLIPITKKLSSMQGRVRNYLEPIMAENQQVMTADIDKINAHLYNSSLIITILSIVAIGLASFIGFLLVRKVRNSINRPVDLLKHLMVGATSENVEPTNDELGVIIEASNKVSENIRNASAFAEHIGEGNFDYQFEPVGEKDILGNALVKMRKQLKSISEEDHKRSWTTEGLAHFGSIFRQSENMREMANLVISELVKYLKANQGTIFILNDDDLDHKYLELVGCYAYNRVKYLEKNIEPGQGLAGQCYLEKETIYLLDIPDNYVSITSGLGDANPNCLLIVPLKLNDAVEGVIELATFEPLKDFEVQFVEQVAESIASNISTAKVNYRTKRLLEDSQQNTEELRAQEEEMRQNMEELQATQEDMQRRNQEFINMQEQLEAEKSMFHILLDYIPDRVTFKDANSKILRVNKAKASKMNLAPESFVGKSDYDFFSKEHADKAIAEEQKLIQAGNPLLNITEELEYNNEKTWVTTSRIPFHNSRGEVTGMFIISKDETDLKKLQLAHLDQNRMIENMATGLRIVIYKISFESKLVLEHGSLDDLGLNSEQIDKPVWALFSLNEEEVISVGSKPFTFETNFKEIKARHYLFSDSVNNRAYLGYAQLIGH